MESMEKAALESIRRQPETTPDGKLWRFHVPPKSYTKEYILRKWDSDAEMKQGILERYMDLLTHMAGKR